MKNQLKNLAVLLILGCSTKPGIQSESIVSDSSNYRTDYTSRSIDSVLYSKVTLHHFSSITYKDTFKITVTGSTIRNGNFRFLILSNDGQLIFDESHETTELLDYGLKPNSTEDEREEYIKTRIENFFLESNFHQPAISINETFDGDNHYKEIWEEIKADQTAIGFYYLLGEEDGRNIAYAKKSKKVVVYHNCC